MRNCILLVFFTMGVPLFGHDPQVRPELTFNPHLIISTEFYRDTANRPVEQDYPVYGYSYGLPVLLHIEGQPGTYSGTIEKWEAGDRIMPTIFIGMTAFWSLKMMDILDLVSWVSATRAGILLAVESRTRPTLKVPDQKLPFRRLSYDLGTRLRISDALNGHALDVNFGRLVYPSKIFLTTTPGGRVTEASAEFQYADGLYPFKERRPLGDARIQNFCWKMLGRLSGIMP